LGCTLIGTVPIEFSYQSSPAKIQTAMFPSGSPGNPARSAKRKWLLRSPRSFLGHLNRADGLVVDSPKSTAIGNHANRNAGNAESCSHWEMREKQYQPPAHWVKWDRPLAITSIRLYHPAIDTGGEPPQCPCPSGLRRNKETGLQGFCWFYLAVKQTR